MADDKKIIIDEDWKSQVEAERAQATKAPAPSKDAPTAASEGSSDAADPPMPPASFELLLSTLTTEALVALGQWPHPGTGKFKCPPKKPNFYSIPSMCSARSRRAI